MTYRDDREALRGEVDDLQAELAKAREDNARLHEMEQRLAEARRQLEGVERQLASAQHRRPGPGRARMVALALGGSWMVVVIVGVLVLKRADPAPPHIAVTMPAATFVAPLPAPKPLVPVTAPTSPARTEHTQWQARVVHASGVPLAVGSSCTIDADLAADGSGARPDHVVVKCGERVIYDERGQLEGMSQLDMGADELPGTEARTHVYAIRFSDVGQRGDSRNQAQLDSSKRIGKVWSDNLPEFRVDLAINGTSRPEAGPSLLAK